MGVGAGRWASAERIIPHELDRYRAFCVIYMTPGVDWWREACIWRRGAMGSTSRRGSGQLGEEGGRRGPVEVDESTAEEEGQVVS
jgi:hypothetical protein